MNEKKWNRYTSIINSMEQSLSGEANSRQPLNFQLLQSLKVHFCRPDVCLSMHCCICIEKRNQLDVTECFIALMICSTCFGHFYAHHQELETICVLLPPMVCGAWLLVVGGQVQDNRV